MRNGIVGACIACILIAMFACGSDSPTAPPGIPNVVTDTVFMADTVFVPDTVTVTDTLMVTDTLIVTDTVAVPRPAYEFSDAAPLRRNELTNYIGGSLTAVGEGDIVILSDGGDLELMVRGYWHEVRPGHMHLSGEVIDGAAFDASLYFGNYANIHVYRSPDPDAGYFNVNVQLVSKDGYDVLVQASG